MAACTSKKGRLRVPLPFCAAVADLGAFCLCLAGLTLLASCGGGGGESRPAPPPVSTQTLTISIGSNLNTVAFSARITLPTGAPALQESPHCEATGICRGIVTASAVTDGSMLLNVASPLPFAPGPGSCITCADLSVPEGTLPSDYSCSCLEGVSTQDLQLTASACPAPCVVSAAQ